MILNAVGCDSPMGTRGNAHGGWSIQTVLNVLDDLFHVVEIGYAVRERDVHDSVRFVFWIARDVLHTPTGDTDVFHGGAERVFYYFTV